MHNQKEKTMGKKENSNLIQTNSNKHSTEILRREDYNTVVLSDVFRFPNIRTLDLKETALEVSAIALKAASSVNVGLKMTEDQITDLSFDLCEIFAYESLADVVVMFKMFRQGKIGVNPYTPLKAFDQRYITTILVPEYLDKKAEERESQYKVIKSNEPKIIATIIHEAGIKPDDFSPDDFKVKLDDVEEVDDRFKLSLERWGAEQTKEWINLYKNNPNLIKKIEYAKEFIK